MRKKKHDFKNGVELKHCKTCDTWKPVCEYGKHSQQWDGLRLVCKKCVCARTARYRRNNPEKVKKSKKRSNALYRKKNRDKVLENLRKYRINHRDKIIAGQRRWYKKNANVLKKKLKEQYHSDSAFRIKKCMRSRVTKAIKNKSKCGRTQSMIGCSWKSLLLFLEKQFVDGMNWDNFGKGAGKWSVDHMMPCDSFDLTQKEEQLKCFHFTNLQPLWEEINIAKFNHIIYDMVWYGTDLGWAIKTGEAYEFRKNIKTKNT